MKITRSELITHRFMWWAPWGVTRWWLPRVFMGGDEWCNVPICVNAPPLGCLIFFRPFGRLRELPCDECWWALDQAEQADYAPCGWLRGGRIRQNAHHHTVMKTICPEAWEWLLGGEADRERVARVH
jgi:hypothetical protein